VKRALEAQAGPVWRTRLELLARALGRDLDLAGEVCATEIGRRVHELVDPRDHAEVWLALSVMTAKLPLEVDVEAVAMASEFDDGEALGEAVVTATDRESLRRDVELPDQHAVLLDVTTTLASPYMTGIQRVVRESVARWLDWHPAARAFVWTTDETAPRRLDQVEREHLEAATGAPRLPTAERGVTVMVPWRCTFLVPELPANVVRSARMQALARHSRSRTAAIGYDVVVVTSGETRIDHRTETYYSYLSALQGFDVVAPISGASAAEFGGWATALGSIGRTGPELATVPLPVAIDRADPGTRDEVARTLGTRLPVVLVVGSHEPRKNHLAILHAAELLWREGHGFRLVFVGGRAWGSDDFGRRVSELATANRPIDVFSGVGDDFLAAAYEQARFTVFPSFNEGFGLPVGESLALGTPVVTASYGSMAEIAAAGGALTVDPRDDHAIADAMRRLLTDDTLLAGLEEQARNRPARTWDDYARETWSVLVGEG
jgi:glycosyltransferase involved in cell wall biosynthesis